MTDHKIPHEKISSLGASVANKANEVMHEAMPAVDRITHRVKDDLHHLRHTGEDLAYEAQHKLKSEARHLRVNAEHFIQHQPFNSILIAASTGAITALAVSWLMRSRSH